MKQKASAVSNTITTFQKNRKGLWGSGKTRRVEFKDRCLLWPLHTVIVGIRHTCNYHIVIVNVMCRQMVAMFGKGDNTEF